MIIFRPAAVNESRYFISPEETKTGLSVLTAERDENNSRYSTLPAVLRLFEECRVSGVMVPPEIYEACLKMTA
jgi:hypothetical protein